MNAELREAVAGVRMALLAIPFASAPRADLDVLEQALRDQEAEIGMLRKIEEERWSVVATRNAAVDRAEKAEALLRECETRIRELCACYNHPLPQATLSRITAHLGANHEQA